jgi:hypothetical protein
VSGGGDGAIRWSGLTRTLGVMSAGGRRLKSLVVEKNGREVVEAVRGIGGRVHVCLEEGRRAHGCTSF